MLTLTSRWRIISAIGLGAVAWHSQSTGALAEGCPPACVIDDQGRTLRLRQLQVFFRHGARTPIHSVPGNQNPSASWDADMCQSLPDLERTLRITDANGAPRPTNLANEKQKLSMLPGGCHLGCLTKTGRQDVFELGRRLRTRYMEEIAFLPTDYNSEQVTVRSTNIERTIESARMVVSGLFGTIGEDRATIARLRHPMVARAYHARNDQTQSEFTAQMARLLRVGEEEIHYVGLRDNFVARLAHNKSIPPGITRTMMRRIEGYAVRDVVALFQDRPEETLRLTCGLVIKDILNNMQHMQEHPLQSPPLRLYSAHDTTLMPLLLAFGAFDGHWPPYAADITLELFEDQHQHGDYYVRALYCGEIIRMPNQESDFVPYKVFHAAMDRLVPKNLTAECRLQNNTGANLGDGDGSSF
ncbi:uncharacterized protein MONBRDRAFT_30813 [Monosiga brevicollis MX1]|uniref:Acid phosphatase n=1 Tax=Monosiga brevicollis TaxID=81824 RepID=A9UPF5_MONBE|nr:uncharacterized protein MONBRDRAFT_30813 [Monosiga brevicollis MX1]EDQ92412.1 predicted protein [Monosiga brevicollis MX1]|eukprot:XP_001742174.1 hypothetical protein [Monosiga brevicollis MX1]